MCRWDLAEDCTFWQLRPLVQNDSRGVNLLNLDDVFDEVNYVQYVVIVVLTTAANNNNNNLQQLNVIRMDYNGSESGAIPLGYPEYLAIRDFFPYKTLNVQSWWYNNHF